MPHKLGRFQPCAGACCELTPRGKVLLMGITVMQNVMAHLKTYYAGEGIAFDTNSTYSGDPSDYGLAILLDPKRDALNDIEGLIDDFWDAVTAGEWSGRFVVGVQIPSQLPANSSVDWLNEHEDLIGITAPSESWAMFGLDWQEQDRSTDPIVVDLDDLTCKYTATKLSGGTWLAKSGPYQVYSGEVIMARNTLADYYSQVIDFVVAGSPSFFGDTTTNITSRNGPFWKRLWTTPLI